MAKTKTAKGKPPPRKPPPKKKAKKEGALPSKRALNYTEEEDKCLAQAFCSVTGDPTVGTDQKGADFWGKVKAKFDTLYKAYVDGCDDDVLAIENGRDQNSLTNRFQKALQKETFLFNSYTCRS